MTSLLRLALSDLAHDPLRTLFSAIGIAAVVLSILLLNALTNGLSAFLSAAPLSTNLLIIDASFINPSDSSIPADLATALQSWVPTPVQHISAEFYRQVRIDGRIIQLHAADPADWPLVYHMTLVEGRWPASGHEIIIGEGTSSANNWPVGRPLSIFGEDFTISGIYRAPGTGFSAVWMSLEAAQALFGPEHLVQILILMLVPGADPAAVSSELQNSPAIAGKFSVFLEDSYTRRNGEIIRDMFNLISLVSIIILLAVPLSSYSFTLLSMAERTRVLGILRAVGFTPAAIRWFLLLRTLVLVLGAYLLGLGGALVYIAIRKAVGPIFILGFPLIFTLRWDQSALYLVFTMGFALVGARLSSGQLLNVPVNELLIA